MDHVLNLGSSMSLATCSTNMLNFLEIKQVNIEIAQNWYDVANGIMDLYDFVSRNMDKAKEMNLGRSNLRQLKNLVQPTDTGISPESVSNTHTAAAVSYTHLDVYKRQIPKGVRKVFIFSSIPHGFHVPK